MMSRVEELAKVLRGINDGVVSEEEARRVLSRVDPVELSLAEQQLISEGVEPQELRRLCAAHMKVLEKDTENLKAAVGEGHPLHTLISEHELILAFLDSLEAAVARLQMKEVLAPGDEDLVSVERLAEHLVETEKHHKREEDALFPAIEERGITGPTRVMRLEHNDMRPKKRHLLDIARGAGAMHYDDFARDLRETSAFIISNLRDHIFKENTILYPAAYRAIRDPRVWDAILKKCDEIGYCCFTPRKSGERLAGGDGESADACCL